MILVDSHCHIDFEPLAEQMPDVLQRAQNNEVAYMLCVSVNLEDHPGILKLAEQHPHIFASVGVHPNSIECEEPGVDQLVNLARHPKVVAIGETGLDYFHSDGDLDWQRTRFQHHIEAAIQCDKPLIIHTRAAAADTMEMLHLHDAGKCGAVMHCFAEDWDTAKQALDLGFYISFSGIVTFKTAESLRDVARRTPLDRLLIETDAPYLAPVPFRGKTNEPSFVLHTAELIAEIRGESLETIANATTDNFFRLFKGAAPACVA